MGKEKKDNFKRSHLVALLQFLDESARTDAKVAQLEDSRFMHDYLDGRAAGFALAAKWVLRELRLDTEAGLAAGIRIIEMALNSPESRAILNKSEGKKCAT